MCLSRFRLEIVCARLGGPQKGMGGSGWFTDELLSDAIRCRRELRRGAALSSISATIPVCNGGIFRLGTGTLPANLSASFCRGQRATRTRNGADLGQVGSVSSLRKP